MRQAGMGLVVAAALVAGTTFGTGGCSSQTKAQQQQAKLEKQRQKEAMARAKEEARQLKQQHEQIVKETEVQQAQATVSAHEDADRRATLLTTDTDVVPPQPTGYPDDRFDVIGAPLIRPENTQRQFDKFNEAMAAAGAKQEGMLREQDFDGAALNTLGRSKIALMMEQANPGRPVTIYVAPRPVTAMMVNGGGSADAAAGRDELEQAQALNQARLAAVQEYWRTSPFGATALQVKAGLNPATARPSQDGLNALRNLNRQQNAAGSSTNNLSGIGSGTGTGAGGMGTGSGGTGGGYSTPTPGTP